LDAKDKHAICTTGTINVLTTLAVVSEGALSALFFDGVGSEIANHIALVFVRRLGKLTLIALAGYDYLPRGTICVRDVYIVRAQWWNGKKEV